MAVFSAVPSCFALTARPSVIGTAMSRIPTMATYITGGTNTTTTTNTTLLANADCIEAYTSCLKGGDVCGANFEECTNNTLFFSKRPLCTSTLMQCENTGVSSLFGTSNQAAFANKDANGEYVYPTPGSVLGQLIEAASISNRYDTSDCVKRYTNCLKKEDVCGTDFELCTSNTEFKKQKLFCESTLARCQDEGVTELFGSTNKTANPTSNSRVGIMISEGAALAAVNAVSTCYKVVDQCFLNACAANPYKCKEGSTQEIIKYADNASNTNGAVTTGVTDFIQTTINRSEVSGFLKNACLDTIGANKYCYATFLGNGVMPTNSQLNDEDNKNDIYAEAYSSRMNDAMRSKIDDLITQFDKKVKERCSETIVSCAMRTCGEGSGAACYASAFNSANKIKGVTNPSTMEDIKVGCEAVINNDTACQYATATFDTTTGALIFEDNSLFDKLFTSPDDVDVANPDPVGAVATLNSRLATSYNQAALDQMKKQCEAVATSCVKSMCGTDYQNCYRNRTDIMSTLTNTGNNKFDKSMNKVGGVLDHTIILGLCLNTVKNNSACEEHIKAEIARNKADSSYTANSWGAGITDTRTGWLDAGNYGITTEVQDIDADGNLLCTTAQDGDGSSGRCDDPSGMYIYPKMVSQTTYAQNLAERQVFRDLIADLEMEAQAQYNAKLTYQQNMCMSMNEGGVIGNKDTGSAYMWVKLRSNKIPSDYSTMGLAENDFTASNDLYGSFCRVRVTLQSEDTNIQNLLKTGKFTTAYFATGDTFTCGSWIGANELEAIANKIAEESVADKAEAQKRTRTWLTVLGTLGSGIGGGYLTDSLQDGDFLGGLLGTNNKKDDDSDILYKYTKALNAYVADSNPTTAQMYGETMISLANQAEVDAANITAARNALNNTLGISQAAPVVQSTKSVYSYSDYQTAYNQAGMGNFEQPGEKMLEIAKAYNLDTTSAQEVLDDTIAAYNSYVICQLDKTNSCFTEIYKLSSSWETFNEEFEKLGNAIQLLGNATNVIGTPAVTNNTATVAQNKSAANATFTSLKTAVEFALDKKGDSEDESKAKRTRSVVNLVGAAATATAGGIIINRLTNDIQQTSLDADKKAAYTEWMNNVGSKIHCYIGAEYAGDYGNRISVSIE